MARDSDLVSFFVFVALLFLFFPVAVMVVSSDLEFRSWSPDTCAGRVVAKSVFTAGLCRWGEVWIQAEAAPFATRRIIFPAVNKYFGADSNQVRMWIAGFPDGSIVNRACYVERSDDPSSDAITETADVEMVRWAYTDVVLVSLILLGLSLYICHALYPSVKTSYMRLVSRQ